MSDVAHPRRVDVVAAVPALGESLVTALQAYGLRPALVLKGQSDVSMRRHLRQTRADVILIVMVRRETRETLAWLPADFDRSRVFLLPMTAQPGHHDLRGRMQAAGSGPVGLPYGSSVRKIAEALMGACSVPSPGLTAPRTPSGPGDACPPGRLTGRELDVVTCLGHGASNKGVALALGIEVGTVKIHVHNILRKLELSSRGEVVALMNGHASDLPARASALPEGGRPDTTEGHWRELGYVRRP